MALALVVAGLWLAALSNPDRYSLSVRDDQKIAGYGLAGLACTLVGVGLFLAAARHTTAAMPAEQRKKANLGVGLGFILQLAGVALVGTGGANAWMGPPLVLASVPALVWGCVHYAVGKRRPKLLGLLGVLGIVGLVALIVLPPREARAGQADTG